MTRSRLDLTLVSLPFALILITAVLASGGEPK